MLLRERVSVSAVCILVLSPNGLGRLITLLVPQLSCLQNERDNTQCGYEEQGWQMGKNNTIYSWVKHFQRIHLHISYLIRWIYR